MRFQFLRLFSAYRAQMDKRPMLTQILTAGALVTAGDAIAQTVIEKKKKYDFRRTAVMATCGLGYFGPLCGAWLFALNKWRLHTVVCVALDQFAFAPPILAGFFMIQSLLSGKPLSSAIERVQTDLFDVVKLNWTIWIPVQLANFWLVPFQYRMLCVQTVALFWNCYLSNKANKVTQSNHQVYIADE